MALKKVTAEEVADLDKRSIRKEGWYCLALSKTTLDKSKATQSMGKATFKILGEEGNPDSATGSAIDYLVMFPDVEDEGTFAESVAAKTNLSGEALDEAIGERMRMAKQGARNFALALLGDSDFTPVPRWDREGKTFRYADGSETNKEGKDSAVNNRNAEAYNAAVDIFNGDLDVTRYVTYGRIAHREFNGQTQEEIKTIRSSLPDGETLVIG